jgi:hypothetical protein
MIVDMLYRGGTVSALILVCVGLSGVCDMILTKILRAMVLPLLAVAASFATPAAHAIPMDYTVSYSGSSVGPGFNGSFSWDSTTSAFTNFNWNLSAIPDSLSANNWRSLIFGGTMGQFLFEILTGEDVHPSTCSATSRCTFTSAKVTSGLVNSVEFRTLGTGVTEYSFRNGSTILYSGTLSVSHVVLLVSEPFTLLLMGAGLLALALSRRKSSPSV